MNVPGRESVEPSGQFSDDGRTPSLMRLEFNMTPLTGELTNISQVEFQGKRIPSIITQTQMRDTQDSAMESERDEGLELISEAMKEYLSTEPQLSLLVEASVSRSSSVTFSLVEMAKCNRELLELVVSRPEVALPIMDAQATQMAKEHLLRTLVYEWMNEVETSIDNGSSTGGPSLNRNINDATSTNQDNGDAQVQNFMKNKKGENRAIDNRYNLSDLPEDAQSLILNEINLLPQISVRVEGFPEINTYSLISPDNGMSAIVLGKEDSRNVSSSLRVLESPFLLGRVVYLEGIITKVSPIIPEIKQICFVCRSTETRAVTRINRQQTGGTGEGDGLGEGPGDLVDDGEDMGSSAGERRDIVRNTRKDDRILTNTTFCGATVWSDTTTNTMTTSPNPTKNGQTHENNNMAAIASAAAGYANNNNTPLVLIPLVCPICKRRGTMVPDYSRSIYEDTQMLTMQDDIITSTDTARDESTNANDTTNTMPAVQRLFIHGGTDNRNSLIDYVTPGDRVRVTGVYRCRPKKSGSSGNGTRFSGGDNNTVIDVSNNTTSINANNAIRAPGGNIMRSIFNTYIDVISISKIKRTRKEIDAIDERILKTGEIMESMNDNISDVDSRGIDLDHNTNRINNFDNNNNDNGNNITNIDPSVSTLLSAELMIERQIIAIASDKNVIERLVASIAPSIHGMEYVKRGLLCQLVGGVEKGLEAGISNTNDGYSAVPGSFSPSTNGFSTRGSIHVLLCGDPGTAKSQLLTFIHSISARSVYTSGKGASSAGLTAYVTKSGGNSDDPDAPFSLAPGALLLSSPNGILCLDELDKLPQDSQLSLHEAMESQRVSIAKAGIVCNLQCTASVLAAANPIKSRWDKRRKIGENIGMGAGLISRFDLVFVVLDAQTPEEDAELARHVVGMFYDDDMSVSIPDHSRDKHGNENNNNNNNNSKKHRNNDELSISDDVSSNSDGLEPVKRRVVAPISPQLLTRYIARAKTIRPVLTGPAKKQLLREYLSLRSTNEANANVTGYAKNRNLNITPRHLESLIRLSEAFARLRLSVNVMLRDVLCATDLMKNAIKNGMLDSQLPN